MSEQRTGQISDKPPQARHGDRSLVVKVYQIIDGEYVCHCGDRAVLSISSPPDAEPGTVCGVHGMQWLNVTMRMLREITGLQLPEELPSS